MRNKALAKLEISGKKTRFDSISLSQDIHDHHHFTIECDALDLDQKDGVIGADDTYVLIGEEVNIQVKARKDESKALNFKGFIEQVELAKGHRTYDRISLTGISMTKLVDASRLSESYTGKTLKQIAETVLKPIDKNLNIDIPNDMEIPFVTQYGETGFDFISRLAFKKGLWFYHNGEKTQLGGYNETNKYKMKLGPDVGTYNLNLKIIPYPFSSLHYNYLENESFEVCSTDASKPKMDRFGDKVFEKSSNVYKVEDLTPSKLAFEKQGDLEAFVENRVNSAAAQMCKLYGDSSNPGINLGTNIELIDRRDDSIGNYLVVSIMHDISKDGTYENRFEAIPASLNAPPPNPFVVLPKAKTQIATVKENEDPESLGRIKVQFPWQDKNETTPWIRVIHPYAGSGDHYFCPEIDDQVMVGFEFDNPDRPFVIGSLYHGQAKPKDFNDKNEIKAIRTKAGHQIIFSDGDPGHIEIITADEKCSISLSNDSDGVIEIISKGELKLEGKSISIKAEEMIIESDKGIDIKSGKDTTLKGANITIEGDQAATLKGADAIIEGQASSAISGAQVNIDGSATTAITGGLITLN